MYREEWTCINNKEGIYIWREKRREGERERELGRESERYGEGGKEEWKCGGLLLVLKNMDGICNCKMSNVFCNYKTCMCFVTTKNVRIL